MSWPVPQAAAVSPSPSILLVHPPSSDLAFLSTLLWNGTMGHAKTLPPDYFLTFLLTIVL